MIVNKIADGPTPLFQSRVSKKRELPINVQELIFRGPTPVVKRRKESFSTEEIPKKYIEQLPDYLRNSAQDIEDYLEEKCVNNDLIFCIREKICHIAKTSLRPERQRAEIGVLFYYVVTGKSIERSLSRNPGPLRPGQASHANQQQNPYPSQNPEAIYGRVLQPHTDLIRKLIEEVLTRCHRLIEKHKRLNNKDLMRAFPSGKTAYLLNLFAELIFLSEGIFNRDGCLTVVELLNSSLANLITEEVRKQILVLVEFLIQKPEFRTSFFESFKVDESLKQIILIDIKRAPTDKVPFLHLQRDLFIALCLMVGQHEERNCYAQAFFSNLQANHFDVMLNILIDLLRKGHLAIDNLEIPILPLLASRRRYNNDFNHILTPEQARNLVGFSVAEQLLKPSAQKIESKDKSLEQIILNYFGSNADYAKELILSYKRNFLQQVLLVVLQFLGTNSDPFGQRVINTAKVRLIETFYEHFIAVFEDKMALEMRKDNDFKKFIDDFKRAVSKHFFLVNYEGGKISFEDGYVLFDHHTQRLPFDGIQENYKPFCAISRLFYLSEGQFLPVDRLSQFTAILCQILQGLDLTSYSALAKRGYEKLENFIRKDFAKELIAGMIQKWNQKRGFLWDADLYHSSDALILLQFGGSTSAILRWDPIKPLFQKSKFIKDSTDIKALFIAICSHIKDYFSTHSTVVDKIPLGVAATKTHCLNLLPYRFKPYLSDPDLLLERIFKSGHDFWQQPLTYKKQRKILKQIYSDKFLDVILTTLPDEPIPLYAFRELILEQDLDEDLSWELDQAIEKVMERIDLAMIESHLPSILTQEGIEIENRDYQTIKNELAKKPFFSPYKLARTLNKALMKTQAPHFIPSYQLEDRIRSAFGFKRILEIGDLNWSGYLREKIHRSKLILSYDIALNNLQFYNRKKGLTCCFSPAFSSSFLKNFQIIFSQPNGNRR